MTPIPLNTQWVRIEYTCYVHFPKRAQIFLETVTNCCREDVSRGGHVTPWRIKCSASPRLTSFSTFSLRGLAGEIGLLFLYKAAGSEITLDKLLIL